MDALKINPDLQRERDSCTFSVTELTNLIDGGVKNTEARRKKESILLEKGVHLEEVPSEYLSHKEKYEQTVKKICNLVSTLRKLKDEGVPEFSDPVEILNSPLGVAIIGDHSPFLVHYVMFTPMIKSQCTAEQLAKWVDRAENFEIIGAYAQTELGHGTFLRGLETTATYDPTAKEFELHSPTLTSYKWWIGGLGQTANYCVVLAQLYTNGEWHGIHPFIVQLREEETHMPLPGITIGEIGAKLGMNGANNGFLRFNKVRIPRENMMMKNSMVLEDGTYVKAPSSKLVYGTMVYVRVYLVYFVYNFMARAVTIATRYSAVRHQSQPKPNAPEPQILDYVTRQHKVMVGIAAVHAFRINYLKLLNLYNNCVAELQKGNLDRLAELHALSCCMKAVSTADASECVERCRLACGGHGYIMSSNFPLMYGMVTAAYTVEGEYTVLHLQTARYLMKAWQKVQSSQKVTATVAYLARGNHVDNTSPWENTVQGIVRGFQNVALGKINQCAKNIEKRLKKGVDFEDAWNMTSVQLVSASEAHCRTFILSSFYEETQNLLKTASPELQKVLVQLVELYSVYWALERVGDLLQFTSISQRNIEQLETRYEDLLMELRTNAVGLVDAFDIRDELLHSPLGAYDGRVYERLMTEAMKSPLNAEPVNQSFHKYLKPFMQGKL